MKTRSRSHALIGIGAVFLFLLGWAATPLFLPAILAWIRPDIVFRGSATGKVVYLTIDDAPTTGTAAIVDVLRKHRVPATFFVISGRVRTDDQLRELVRDGFTLGNHLRTTRACSKLSWEEFVNDFDDADRAIRHVATPRWFRPASGLCSARQAAYAKQRGYGVVLGTVYPLDAQIANESVLRTLVRWLTVRGGILIMHDGAERAARTAAVLDQIIPELKAAGWEFGKLDDLRRPAGS